MSLLVSKISFKVGNTRSRDVITSRAVDSTAVVKVDFSCVVMNDDAPWDVEKVDVIDVEVDNPLDVENVDVTDVEVEIVCVVVNADVSVVTVDFAVVVLIEDVEVSGSSHNTAGQRFRLLSYSVCIK
jgi:hypothetical protein